MEQVTAKIDQLHYMYSYENNINGMIYIGQTKDIPNRSNRHLIAHKYKNALYVDNAIHKYGIANFTFTIFAIVDSQDKANSEEIFWIAELRRVMGEDMVYNAAKNRGKKRNDTFKEKVRGENCGTAILDTNKVKSIRQLYSTGKFSAEMLANQFSVGKTTIYRILNKESWTHIEYPEYDLVYAILHGKISERFSSHGELNGNAVLSYEKADKIRKIYAGREHSSVKITRKYLADMFGVATSTIDTILKNKRWVR